MALKNCKRGSHLGKRQFCAFEDQKSAHFLNLSRHALRYCRLFMSFPIQQLFSHGCYGFSLVSVPHILSSTKERICRSCPRDMKLDISYLAKMRQSLTFAFYHYVYLKAWRFQQDISHPPDLPPRLYFMLLRNSLIKLQILFAINNNNYEFHVLYLTGLGKLVPIYFYQPPAAWSLGG